MIVTPANWVSVIGSELAKAWRDNRQIGEPPLAISGDYVYYRGSGWERATPLGGVCLGDWRPRMGRCDLGNVYCLNRHWRKRGWPHLMFELDFERRCEIRP